MKLDILEMVVPPHRAQDIIKQFRQEAIGILLSEELFDEGTFLVFATREETPLLPVFRIWSQDPAIFLDRKRNCEVYRLQTLTSSIQELLKTFPLNAGEEWFIADLHTAYLCLLSPYLSAQQVAWLATCPSLHKWEYSFPLSNRQKT